MKPVANQLGRDFRRLEDGADQSGGAMMHPGHAVEQVRRLAGARGDPLERLVVRCGGVPERHAMAARGQPPNQIDAAVELGRHRDNPDVGRGPFDFVQEVGRRKTIVVVADRVPDLDRAAERRARAAQAEQRLRTAKLRADEVALEMRRQHPGGALRRRRPRRPHLGEDTAELVGRARDCCRTEGRDAVTRQARGNGVDRIA